MRREAAKVGERRCIGIRGMRRGDCQKCTHTDRPPRNLKHKHTNPNSRAWFHSSVLLPPWSLPFESQPSSITMVRPCDALQRPLIQSICRLPPFPRIPRNALL